MTALAAYDLAESDRAAKFKQFDAACARLVEASAWTDEPTWLGGLHGEVAIEAPGAVPTTELVY